ncbi:uncharacterized protein I303_108112 [Kwoniella dejecticola CBS 10117]|uniref:Zn(2)-C6 fungal-type domain-containing protein n=1 Tax=Kwoniella dejecticola CBS 10117 TaxID=1296121 RepID=A0AAJ8MKX4_9TREE
MSTSETGAGELDANQETPKRTRKRKHREPLSCAECRRTKVKCDRQVPCGSCVKLGCGNLCPDGARPTLKPRASTHSHRQNITTESGDYVSQLTRVLQEHGLPIPAKETTSEVNASALSTSEATSIDPNDLRLGTDLTLSADFHQDHLPHTGPSPPPVQANLEQRHPHFAPDHMHQCIPSASMDVRSDSIHRQADTPSSSLSGVTSGRDLDRHSHGLLVLNRRGRSKYLGPTAASEWLRDENHHRSVEDTPAVSRANSPDATEASAIISFTRTSFPFSSPRGIRTADLLRGLPIKEEAYALVESFHQYFGWSYDLVPRKLVNVVLDEAYTAKDAMAQGRRTKVDYQDLGMLFMVFAMGAIHNVDMPADDPMGDDFVACARDSLAKGNFMIDSSLSGLRALNIMAHYHLETDRGRNGDWAWPLWGLAMRIIQAMGLHRDGERWKLSPQIVNERRRMFWETHSVEVFQGNCFSRP